MDWIDRCFEIEDLECVDKFFYVRCLRVKVLLLYMFNGMG